MVSAEIIAIGSELLLGETQDTNTNAILRYLRGIGINVFRTQIVGDNAQRIASIFQEALSRADIVITTGGLGPTIDDPTREAAAIAFHCPLVFHETLWDEILAYFQRMNRIPSENNKRQAFIPEVATILRNPVGTAPSFVIHHEGKMLICLPGVPAEMKFLMEQSVLPMLQHHYPSETILIRTLHTYGVGESIVDELVADLEASSNPTLGLSAKMGQIDLRITAKAKNHQEAEAMLDNFEMQIRERLKDSIFGKDGESLAEVVSHLITKHHLFANLFETGKSQMVADALNQYQTPGIHSHSSENYTEMKSSFEKTKKSAKENQLFLFCASQTEEDQFTRVELLCEMGNFSDSLLKRYNAITFSKDQTVLMALELIRQAIIKASQEFRR